MGITNLGCLGRRDLVRAELAIPTVVLFLLLPVAGISQESANQISETILPSYKMIERSFLVVADAMPAEKYTFKPTSGEFKDVRTFGEQVKHVACANFAFFNEIEKKEPPSHCETGGPSPAKTKAELMVYLRESFAYGERVLQSTTSTNALEPASGPYGGKSTRLGLVTMVVWHASDH